jgi:MinD superfamily P-loop ATPase
MCADPGHNGTQVTEKVTIQGGKGTTGESELGATIMREERVSVLQKGDQDKPMVDPNLPISAE